MKIISFKAQPPNYAIINSTVSRSAQPKKEDFTWLKEQGVTDIVNFRTMGKRGVDFNEKEVVEQLGMTYHHIPCYTRHPSEENVKKFLNLTEIAENQGKKLHIHCMAGADRTGMMSFIYKFKKNIGTESENIAEWLRLGHHNNLFPNLISWTQEFCKKMK